jgi:uncharacterized LabA/DUF88 family protein
LIKPHLSYKITKVLLHFSELITKGNFLINFGNRVYAFIDSQNLNLGTKKDLRDDKGNIYYHGWELSFKKFYFYIKTKLNVSKAYLFIGKIPKYQRLYNYLSSIGYILIFKPTITHTNSNGKSETKGNVDAELVLHTMLEKENYDKAVIVSGDGDYACLLEHLDFIGKLHRVVIPNKFSYSQLLNPYQKYFLFVTDLKTSLIK